MCTDAWRGKIVPRSTRPSSVKIEQPSPSIDVHA
jgi:hypothetical protein